jgi:hypothetical protein
MPPQSYGEYGAKILRVSLIAPLLKAVPSQYNIVSMSLVRLAAVDLLHREQAIYNLCLSPEI